MTELQHGGEITVWHSAVIRVSNMKRKRCCPAIKTEFRFHIQLNKMRSPSLWLKRKGRHLVSSEETDLTVSLSTCVESRRQNSMNKWKERGKIGSSMQTDSCWTCSTEAGSPSRSFWAPLCFTSLCVCLPVRGEPVFLVHTRVSSTNKLFYATWQQRVKEPVHLSAHH